MSIDASLVKKLRDACGAGIMDCKMALTEAQGDMDEALKILRKNRTVRMVSMTDMASEDSYSDIPHPEFIAPWSQTADEIAQQAEVQAELEKALLELADKYRLVFVLRDVEGLSVRETAQALELTESTVKVRLLRARLALRERLTKKFGDALQVLTPDHKHS